MPIISKILNNQIIYGGLCFIIGGLFIAIINHFLDLDRQRQINRAIAFQESVKELRKAYFKILVIVEKQGHDTIADITTFFKDEIIIQGIAYKDFMTFIPKSKINKYKETYNNYISKVYNGGISGKDTPLEIYEKLIHEILLFIK